MKLYGIFLLILLLVLQYKLWFEEGGYFHNRELQKQLAAVRIENEQLREKNRELARRIILVKGDMNEIESLARQNLGMIKEDEQFMFLIDEDRVEMQQEKRQDGQQEAGRHNEQ